MQTAANPSVHERMHARICMKVYDLYDHTMMMNKLQFGISFVDYNTLHYHAGSFLGPKTKSTNDMFFTVMESLKDIRLFHVSEVHNTHMSRTYSFGEVFKWCRENGYDDDVNIISQITTFIDYAKQNNVSLSRLVYDLISTHQMVNRFGKLQDLPRAKNT